MENNKNKNLKGDFGFTIMEIVVVIFVISLGLIGILSLVTQNMQVEYINKNMLIASQLTQEGLELVRNIRDNNWLNDRDWKTGGNPNTDIDIIHDGNYAIFIDSGGNDIDILEVSGIDSSGISDSNAKLYIDSNGFYRNYDVPGNATSTIFSRIIVVESGTGTEASSTISCLVQWDIRNNTYQYSAQTVLYDWR